MMNERLHNAASRKEVLLLTNLMKMGDTETYSHCIRVGKIVSDMLEHTDHWNDEEKEEIVVGALVHDIGKLWVPLNLIQVPWKLTNEEYNIVKIHALVSYEIVKDVFSPIVKNICLYHHEKPNGTGYMQGVALSSIPEEALFVQVADIYEALTRERSYKKSYTPKKAIEEMEKESRQMKIDDGYLEILKRIL